MRVRVIYFGCTAAHRRGSQSQSNEWQSAERGGLRAFTFRAMWRIGMSTHRPLRLSGLLAFGISAILFGASAAIAGGGNVLISEIRIAEPVTENNEYLELSGVPGTSLTGLTYLVIGDGGGQSGVIEALIHFDGVSIGPSGYFLVAEPTFTLGTPDMVVSKPTQMNFEEDDNVTHVLVSDFIGVIEQDLDTDNDGVLDVGPWSAIVDLIAVIKQENPPTSTEWHYGPPALGPVGISAPQHVYRDCGVWIIGGVDAGSDDTPGAANPNCQGDDCPADIDGGGTVNVSDLLAVIAGWGQCGGAPGSCPADISPPGGDGVVNVGDLLAVIGAWGACP